MNARTTPTPTSEEALARARAFIEGAFAWDNHACMPMRADDHAFLPQLERHRAAGFHMVTLNVGFGEMDIEAHVRMLASLRRWLAEHSDAYTLVRGPKDIEAARAAGKLAVAFDIEGAHAIGDQPSLLSLYRDLGVLWMSLAYNLNNRVGGGCLDEDTGLTAYGREVVAEMERVGMVACLSHTGHRTSRDVLALCTRPVIFSHSNCAAVHAHPRNIPDELIVACARTGGLVGINGVGVFLGRNDISSETFARHVDHAVQLVGPRHVSLALDYVFDQQEFRDYIDSVRHTAPPELGYQWGVDFVAPEQLAGIVAVLQGWGYGEEDLRAILGGNLQRLFWPA